MHTPVRMTPCPLRLQLQTLWTGGILMGNMTIWRVNYLAKVAHTNVTVVLNIPTSVMMTPCPLKTPRMIPCPLRLQL